MSYSIGEALRRQLQGQESADTVRDIEAVTQDILEAKRVGGQAIITIGQRLIEAKGMLTHGEWLPWLTERVEFSERTAQNFMRLAREWSNPQALADLGTAKALTLLALPPEEREGFMAENHLVDGEEKTVVDMTSRELEKAIRERDEARKAAELAKEEALDAEESRAKMAADMQVLKELHQAAQTLRDQAREELAQAQAELKALRERPVDVAVEVDQEAVDQARREAEAQMQAKVDQAEAARKKAEAKCAAAEKALGKAKKQAGANAELISRAERAERELAQAQALLEDARRQEKTAAVNQNGELAMFNVLFNQTQEQVNKMHGLRLKLGKGDPALDEKLKTAITALADAVRRCAE